MPALSCGTRGLGEPAATCDQALKGMARFLTVVVFALRSEWLWLFCQPNGGGGSGGRRCVPFPADERVASAVSTFEMQGPSIAVRAVFRQRHIPQRSAGPRRCEVFPAFGTHQTQMRTVDGTR